MAEFIIVGLDVHDKNMRLFRRCCVRLNLYAVHGSDLKATTPVHIQRRVVGFGKGDWPRHVTNKIH